MIKQNWNISDEDSRRILNLHESATKNHYLLNEQYAESVEVDFNNSFESGQYQLTSKFQKEINQKVLQLVEDIKRKNIKNFEIVITPGESRVTNPSGFEQQGSLAAARAEELKKYLNSILPKMLGFSPSIKVLPSVIGTTPYDKINDRTKKNDPKYKAEQFVRAKAVVIDKPIPDPDPKYVRMSDVDETLYLNNKLVGFIEQPMTKTKNIKDAGTQPLGLQNLIFIEVKPDTQPPQIISKYQIPFEWWNNRDNAGTKTISSDDINYIRTNFEKIS